MNLLQQQCLKEARHYCCERQRHCPVRDWKPLRAFRHFLDKRDVRAASRAELHSSRRSSGHVVLGITPPSTEAHSSCLC